MLDDPASSSILTGLQDLLNCHTAADRRRTKCRGAGSCKKHASGVRCRHRGSMPPAAVVFVRVAAEFRETHLDQLQVDAAWGFSVRGGACVQLQVPGRSRAALLPSRNPLGVNPIAVCLREARLP